ncbi:MAG: membrane protein insertase YidC [Xanthomonadales bacterium]|nr:membrane protein insertase YidC [Xanthomonadales bacterium]
MRPVLLITLVFLAYLIWVEWQKDYGPAPAAPAQSTQTESADVPGGAIPDVPGLSESADGVPGADLPAELPEDLPDLEEAVAAPTAPRAAAPQPQSEPERIIEVTTDVLRLEIDLKGGTVVSASLLNYSQTVEDPEEKVVLLQPSGPAMFIAQSGLLSHQSAPNHVSLYSSTRRSWNLGDADELQVPLTWQSDDGVEVTKTFVLKRGGYDITVRHAVSNRSDVAWLGSRYDQLQRAVPSDDNGGGFNNPERYSFKGIAFYDPEDKFQKVDFEDIADEPFKKTVSGGWLAMVQHYFFAAWIPPHDEQATYSTQLVTSNGRPRYIARDVSPAVQISPAGSTVFESRLYVGPKLQDELPEVAPGLEHTVNYGIFTVFSKPLFWLLEKIHEFVGNWGWAIVILTIIIKLAFFKLTEAQFRSTARMRKLQPRIEQLKERYGDDRQKMSQAMMDLYKKEKVNPFGGCLPILVQIPIFIALYWVLIESVELRQTPFILWIQNLSARDPYFILPALNAVFMIATQRLTPTMGMDPVQRKMMNAMPIVFSVLFAFFPAGLVLYWATNAGLSLAQQLYITRKIENS